MLTKNIKFQNYQFKKKFPIVKRLFEKIKKENLQKKNDLFLSLTTDYKLSYDKKLITKLKRFSIFRIIGMGGSILGSQAIYHFLKDKIKKKFYFLNNLQPRVDFNKKDKKIINLIISKSGNTLETISNTKLLLNNKKKSVFIIGNQRSYLRNLANKMKSQIIEHNNFIGGRYSVLSEVGILPAELMGLNSKKFKQFNFLIKNKKFISQLVQNVESTLYFVKKKKYTSIILNYDERSDNLFKWYQQLIAESLGKKSNGILPVISTMPKDNHSLMQYYLDGPKKSFYTFFSVSDKNDYKINKNLLKILLSQKKATEKVFKNKKLPFRSFEIFKREEKTMGEIFCFFILETILLGKAMNVNPFDQPSVELIKQETKKVMSKN